MQLDTIDLNILTLLQQNGRISNQDLAEQVFLSPSSCLRRVRILEEEGIISRYSALLNPEKLGLELDVFVQVTMRRDVESWHENFMQALQNYPEVVGSYIITGDANYLLRVKARNLKHYSAFVLEKLYKIPGVQDIRSNIVLQAIKETYELPRELLRDA
ncbi:MULTISPECIES: Lrp/AsnC family transcriptional regulator [Collimonas]|jgi:Lrp/AsnC family leucine-responsive transcriptional regulator|uniref:Lrp/AsnC family transcriptional regulator n=1 Tax=Collimonas TaxID=202907 RepID=UPI0008992AC5|nr:MULTISPECIES: Lrp/AsnC family transcriptional regulator [Collimonas]SDX72690.1 transcriptional regulator, AsnC family [Collimonas sp. OK242]SFB28264.1 transcriptional regulator, AsnC family [Collimonas sp. OK607]HWW07487.1 Lrp/AsnC family transcriptional regulator [Collimonas sp.]